jgi:hypothetical protein
MYGVGADLDLNGIVGSYLGQICLGKFDVQFRFSEGTIIAAQCPVNVMRSEAAISVFEKDGNWSNMQFRDLLNLEVKSYSVVNEQTLQITFEGDYSLQLTDDSDQYESFQIYHRGSISEMTIV